MEYDRFKENNRLYITGIISLILCMTSLAFSLYILPNLIWGLHYDVPEFVSRMISYLEDEYRWSHFTSASLVWLIFFIPALITGTISYYVSNNIDDHLLGIEKIPVEEQEQKAEEGRQEFKESLGLGFRILILMVLVVLAVLVVQFLLY